jgi:hypothetical protein
MAGAWGRSLQARTMNCQVAPTSLKPLAWVSSPLPARPRLKVCLISNCGIRVQYMEKGDKNVLSGIEFIPANGGD